MTQIILNTHSSGKNTKQIPLLSNLQVSDNDQMAAKKSKIDQAPTKLRTFAGFVVVMES